MSSLLARSVVTGMRSHPFLWLGVLSFAFAALVAVLIQAVLLPHVLPRLHAGHGLLVGGDWIMFHRVAVELAQEVSRQGGGMGRRAWRRCFMPYSRPSHGC